MLLKVSFKFLTLFAYNVGGSQGQAGVVAGAVHCVWNKLILVPFNN
jgi:hypothetical protein